MKMCKMYLRQSGKKQQKINSFRLDVQNHLYLRVEGNKDEVLYSEKIHQITIGSKEIMPFYSYMINCWNVLLPFIAYKEDEENIRKYLKSIGSTIYDKKDI